MSPHKKERGTTPRDIVKPNPAAALGSPFRCPQMKNPPAAHMPQLRGASVPSSLPPTGDIKEPSNNMASHQAAIIQHVISLAPMVAHTVEREFRISDSRGQLPTRFVETCYLFYLYLFPIPCSSYLICLEYARDLCPFSFPLCFSHIRGALRIHRFAAIKKFHISASQGDFWRRKLHSRSAKPGIVELLRGT